MYVACQKLKILIKVFQILLSIPMVLENSSTSLEANRPHHWMSSFFQILLFLWYTPFHYVMKSSNYWDHPSNISEL